MTESHVFPCRFLAMAFVTETLQIFQVGKQRPISAMGSDVIYFRRRRTATDAADWIAMEDQFPQVRPVGSPVPFVAIVFLSHYRRSTCSPRERRHDFEQGKSFQNRAISVTVIYVVPKKSSRLTSPTCGRLPRCSIISCVCLSILAC